MRGFLCPMIGGKPFPASPAWSLGLIFKHFRVNADTIQRKQPACPPKPDVLRTLHPSSREPPTAIYLFFLMNNACQGG